MRHADPTSARQKQPWLERGVSRATWFRQRRETGKTAVETIKPPEDETGKSETIIAAEGETIQRETRKPLPLVTSHRGPGHCAQCSGDRDGKEVERIFGRSRVLLHPECVRFYVIEVERHASLRQRLGMME